MIAGDKVIVVKRGSVHYGKTGKVLRLTIQGDNDCFIQFDNSIEMVLLKKDDVKIIMD